MKYFLAAILLWSLNSLAQEECSSLWVYKAYKTCEHVANGLDTSKPAEPAITLRIWSDWMKGGKDQRDVCSKVRDKFNAANLPQGSRAELTHPVPVDEESENQVVHQVYKYQCELEVRKYPLKAAANPACGIDEKYSYTTGSFNKDLGQGSCLSCDNLANSKPEVMVECLKNNIANIIEPKAVEIRQSDIKAVAAQAKHMLTMSRHVPIENLSTTEQIAPLVDFVEKAGQ